MKNSQTIGWHLPVVGRYRFGFILGALLLLCAVLSLFLSSPASALTTVPTKMNFQGRLTDSTGNIKPNGTYNMKLRLYTVNSGGSAVWTEDRLVSAGNGVTVTNGLFSIQLGSVTTLPANLFASGALYLEVELPTPATATTSGTPTWTEGAMTPRNQMATSAYAYNAETLDGIDSANFARVDGINTFQDDQYFTYLEASSGAWFGGQVVMTDGSSATLFAADIGAGTVSVQGYSLNVDAYYSGFTGGTLQVMSNDFVVGSSNASFTPSTDSSSSFRISDAASKELFSVDSLNKRVRVGHSTADAVGTVLVLDTKNTSGDPTGVAGAMYYNSNTNKFRCYQASAWTDCIAAGSTNADTLDSLDSTAFGRLSENNTWTGTNTFNGAAYFGAVGILGNFTAANSVLFKPATDSTTAFRVQSSTGSDLLTADTVNQTFTIKDTRPVAIPITGCTGLDSGSGSGPYAGSIGPSGTRTLNCTVSGSLVSGTTYTFSYSLIGGGGDLTSQFCIGAVCSGTNTITPSTTTNAFKIDIFNDPYQGYSFTLENIVVSGTSLTGGLKVTDGTNTTSITAASSSIAGQATFVSQTAGTEVFKIQTSGAAKLFSVDTTNMRIQIGNAVADGTGVVMVLDTKNTTGDPAGTRGAMYYNSFYKRFRCYGETKWVDCRSSAASNTATQAVANTATETNFTANYALEADECVPGRMYKITARGHYSIAANATAPTLNIRVKLGATVLASTGATSLGTAALTNQRWTLEADVVCITSGATGTVEAQGAFTRHTSAIAGIDWAMTPTAATTVNTTTAQNLQVSAQWGVAVATSTITLRTLTINAMDNGN